MDQEEQDLQKRLDERLKQLPKVIRDAINSADVGKRLRELSDAHKLHLDQWELLENEVKLALLGFQPAEDLEKNIKSEVGVSNEIASALAADISKIVFEPIREELERQLEHPDAKAPEVSDVEGVRGQVLGDAAGATAAAPAAPPAPVMPATPPQPLPEGKATRAPISEAYRAGEPSTVRKSIEDDPYRESPA